MFSIWGIGLYMSIARYSKSRVVYKDFDKYCSTTPPPPPPPPTPPTPTGPCESISFNPEFRDFYLGGGFQRCGDDDLTKCPGDTGKTCGELLSGYAKQKGWDPKKDYYGCIVTATDKSTYCLISRGSDESPMTKSVCDSFSDQRVAECKVEPSQ